MGVNRKASNYASRGELSKSAMLIPILKRTLSYINHVNQLPDKTIAKQAFLLSKELYDQDKESFYSNMINTITSYSNANNNPIDLETKIINSGSVEIIKHIKDHYVSFWKKQILKSTKLSFYSNFKKEHKLEEYLTNVQIPCQRKIFTKFRISNHKLGIECGHYQNIPRNERLCNNCNIAATEDEYHFTFECKCYKAERNNSKQHIKMNVTTESKQNLLSHVMSSSDPILVNLFSKFLSDCFTTRDKCFESSTSIK